MPLSSLGKCRYGICRKAASFAQAALSLTFVMAGLDPAIMPLACAA
jgi:hypothetical protein